MLQLLYRYSRKTKIRTCKFTVFVRRPYGLDQAYQLELNQFPVVVKDAHKRSHEHMGQLRTEGDAGWSKWGYDEVTLINWENEQIGVSTDTSLFVAEVAQCLHAWKPNAQIAESPEYVGVSGQTYRLDFDFNDEAVIAITPHHSAVSAAIEIARHSE